MTFYSILKTIPFVFRFLRHTEGGLGLKVQRTIHFTPIFYHNHLVECQKRRMSLEHVRKMQQKNKKETVDFYKSTMSRYFQFKRQIQSTSKQINDQFQDEKQRQSFLKGLVTTSFDYLNLFYESLQALVQGRRQVLQDENFLFQDGRSVKQKRQSFEKRLSLYFGMKPPAKSEEKRDYTQQ